MDESNGNVPMTMLVGPTGVGGTTAYPYPVYQSSGSNDGGFGGDWGWIVLLLLLAGNGGWGMGGGFGFGGGLGYDFPWLLSGQNGINTNVSDGFRDAQLHDSVTSVRDGVSSLSTQLCNCCGDMQMALANSTAGIQQSLCSGFAGTTAAVTGAQNAISQQLYSNELASLNRSFAEQTANTAGFNGVQSALCDIRYGSATNTRDIIESQTRGTQVILDKLCALELEAAKREASDLRQQLTMADLKASQTVQNAFISQGFANEVDALYNRLSNCPVPTTPVYGRTPIFTCNQQPSCGCGCGSASF